MTIKIDFPRNEKWVSLLLIHICCVVAGCAEAFDYVWSNDVEHVFCYFYMQIILFEIYTIIHLYLNGITRYKYLVTIVQNRTIAGRSPYSSP